MSTWRLLLLSAALAAIGGFVWWALETRPLAVPEWAIEAENPWWIGTSEDPFAYAGGDSVELVAGSARIAQAPDEETPTLRASIRLPESRPWPWDEQLPEAQNSDRIVQLSNMIQIEQWEDVSIHGDTGLGDSRLSETHARLAGHGVISLGSGDRTQIEDLPVFWSVAQAIRQSDGSIRQQGLTFSPLLREKRGFSDPDRWELTVLVYAPSTAQSNANENPQVLVQIVYRTLTIVPPSGSG